MRSNEQVSSGYTLQSQMPSLLPQQGRQGHHLSPASGEVGIASRVTPLLNVNTDAHYLVQPLNGLSNHIVTPDRRIIYDEERLERKRKSEEARIAKEVEAHEKRIKKELEKQDILREKKEEQMRKEMERQDRERRKEEERLLREKQREEERYQREQRREMERREKFLQKEYIRAEKMRLKEEMRREKEAAKLKAANDRAAARRIAKESTEMIEDERLELMELAALTRGLSSILALDAETLQNIDMFKDKLPEFPPKSANLKRPFRLQPWTDSEENVGCLLMDPRLLGEIHIALLRSIIKDIEDVARTATTGLVANQNPAVMPGGGHPEIVEGRHLTPLTWPEVLRQFALSAGFGPKLKKRSMELPHFHDEHEA
ncbi:UNVERIFIED_CONTAM: Homeobox-DDT domain protein RLT1 [Sesamum latifolium]|uniref:Homeobox-DDT domain protein RLT1 n=1 Tax=Sesamum latifolium TaxID=2727402 RepID=A0AAW2TK94_9LAMI